MILYEVNLGIPIDIFDGCMAWLSPHIQQMLGFEGFLNAQLCEDISTDNTDATERKITVVYLLDNEDNLQNYFTHHSKKMRSEIFERFGDRFNITRKTLKITNTFN